MSRAFVKETGEAAPPPEKMVETGPNPVTPEGWREIAAHVERLETAMAAEANVLLRETLARDLRYWAARKASAQIVPPSAETGIVAFGSRVTIARGERRQSFRIVGVDETDAARGLISFRSPLAAAILGARKGEIVEAPPPLGEIEVISVEA